MRYDFNVFERAAIELKQKNRYEDALRIYYFMSDGDPSLDGGYLGERIAECYEALGKPYAAKYWYGRAIEENPVVNAKCAEAIKALGTVTVEDLLPSTAFIEEK
jgi:tetratricopeptide (TPR) repeat protein